MTEKVLDAETQRLIASASRYVETPERIAMEVERPASDATTYVIEAPCSVCADPLTKVQVHPRWVDAARCARCIGEGLLSPCEPMPDDRVPTITWQRLKEPFVIEPATTGIALHPQPSVGAFDPIPEGSEPPAVVTALQGAAEAAGWSVNLTYARGHGIHATQGTPTKEVESWALRCWVDGRRAVAVYEGGSWGSMWSVADMFHARTKEQFVQYLAGVDEAWLRRTRALNLEFEAHEACTSGAVHEAHPWWKKDGAGRYCNGREIAKVKKTKESGG